MIISTKKLSLTCLLVIACSSFTVKSDAVYNMKLSRDRVKKTDYSTEELNLMKQLFKSYNQYQKPYGIVQLQFALELLSVVNVRAKEQTVELNTKLYQTWIDGRLIWDAAENNNITQLIIETSRLWIPDTFSYTTSDKGGFILPQNGQYLVLSHDGKITWTNPVPRLNIRCKLHFFWFPFDEQMCKIVFGSWSHTMSYVNYKVLNEINVIDQYQESSQWSLVQYKGFRNEIVYDNWIEKDAFSEIHYKILIRRKPLFMLQNYALPAGMLCIVLLYLFYVPFAQEFLLGINVMLAFSVLKLTLNGDTPVQSDNMPLFTIYFTGCMFSAMLAIGWFQQMNLYTTKKRLPKILRLFVFKAVIPLFRIPKYKQVEVEAENSNESDDVREVKVLEKVTQRQRIEYTDQQLIPFLNDFVFTLFSVYFMLLNTILLVILPFIVKHKLDINE